MAEEGNEIKYLFCSRCNQKYHNNNENIDNDFGYNRLGERYKTCVKCRQYKLDNREKILQQNRERYKDYYETNREEILQKSKNYREMNKEKIYEKINCDTCGCLVCRHGMARHKRSEKCKKKSS